MRVVSRAHCGRIGLLTLTWLLPQGGVAVRAQETTPPEFKSQVEILTLDVVVVDASGKSVAGLTKDDFVVEEDGQRQEIVNFEAVSSSAEAEAKAPEAKAPEAQAAEARATEEPQIATSAAMQRPGRAFVVVVDDLRLPGEQTVQARRTVASFVDKSLGRGDTVVLGTTSGDMWWTARLPEGREDLLAVLDRVKGRYVRSSTRELMTEYEAFWITHREGGYTPDAGPIDAMQAPTSVLQRVAVRYWDENICGHKAGKERGTESYVACIPMVRSAATEIDAERGKRMSITLQALGRAVKTLASSPGHRSLVFLSPGFLQDEDLPQQEVARAALQTHTAVYFVDAQGLAVATGAGPESRPDLQSRVNPSRETQRQVEERTIASGGALALAEETGGFSVRNTNDLDAAVERIAAESRTFYLLGFRPPTGKASGAWRKLRVTVDKGDVTVRARPGYRLHDAPPGALIPLRLASYVLEPQAGDRTRVVAATEVDMSALPPGDSDQANPPLQLRLEAMPRDRGEIVVQDVSLESARAPAGSKGPAGPDWKLARLEFYLPAGVYGIRAFVRDPATGAAGAVEQRVVVPEPAAFRVSTPVLSDKVTASADDELPLTPVPVAHDEFKPMRDRPLRAGFEVIGAAQDPATGKSRVETRFALVDRGGRTLTASHAYELSPSPTGRLRRVIALPQLPGGEYDLVITVDDRVAGTTREMRRRFSFEEPPAPVSAGGTREPAPVTPMSPELAVILDRAALYVLAYGQELSNVIAEEECRQVLEPDIPGHAVRTTRAGVVFISLPGPIPWATFRDVWEVDGNRISDRQDRLARLFRESPATAPERASALLEESARYNLGPVRRTMNLPTFALLFLHHENQSRFAYQLKGQKTFHGTNVVEVAFRERVRPTLVAGDTSAGAPVKGSFWIDPESGAILKTDADYDFDPWDHNHRSRARIITEYRRDPKLGILVPDRMQETYKSPPPIAPMRGVLQGVRARSDDPQEDTYVNTLEATTQYSGYLRFGVSTEESFGGLTKK